MAIVGTFNYTNLIINHCEHNGRSILTNGLESMQKYNAVGFGRNAQAGSKPSR